MAHSRPTTWALIHAAVRGAVRGSLVLGILVPALTGCGADEPRQALTVIDGDTLVLDGQIIELGGIDAPELGQHCLDGSHLYACGREAAFNLNKLVTLKSVQCAPSEQEPSRYDCRTPDGSVELLLVESGLAVARAGGEMDSAEQQARRVPLGIWRGPFVDPRDWRNGQRLPEEEAAGCPVLGLKENGSLVYVVPTDPGYEARASNDADVAQRFCSDEEARAQGYHHRAQATPGTGRDTSAPG